MVGNIVFFIIGTGVGGSLVAYHKWRLQEAVQKERREVDKLRGSLNEELIRNAENSAYSKGFDAGITCPVSDAERLARTFAAHKGSVQIRTQKQKEA